MTTDDLKIYCSFCGKSQHEVRKVIAGAKVFICNECVKLCNSIIDEDVWGDKDSVDYWLGVLRAANIEADAALQRLAAGVLGLRERGVGWAQIASALNISEDEARRKFDVT